MFGSPPWKYSRSFTASAPRSRTACARFTSSPMFESSPLCRETTTSGVHGAGLMPRIENSTGSDAGLRSASAMYAFTPRTYDVMIASPCGWYQFNSAFRSPRKRCSRAPIAAVSDVVPTLGRREERERGSGERGDVVEGARSRGTQERFQFRERHLDRIEVGAVGRQKSDLRAGGFDGRAHLWLFVDG